MYGSGLLTNIRLYIHLFIGNLLAISVGLHYNWPYDTLAKFDTTNPLEEPLILSSDFNVLYLFHTAGCVIGIFLTILGKKYLKQKLTFLIIPVIFVISELIHAFSKSYEVFCVARFITGLAVGSTYVMLPTYFAEISPKSEKAAHISAIFVFVQIGELFGAIIIMEYLEEDLLKVYSLICLTAPCLFFVLFAMFVPESPVQLVAQSRDSEAQEEIKKLRGTTFIKEEYEEIVNVQSGFYKSLTSNRALHVIFGLATFQQLSGAGFYSVVETYNVITISNTIGTFENHLYIYYSFKILGTIIGVAFLHKMGLKESLMLSAGVMMVLNIFLAIYFDRSDFNWWTDDGLLSAFILLLIFYNIGVGPAPWLLMAESFPPKMKSVATAMIGICPFIIAFIYYIVIAEYDFEPYTIYGIGAAFSIIILAYTWFIPETKNKSTLEIQHLFNEKVILS